MFREDPNQLPTTFTLEQLSEVLTAEEIAAYNEGDDPLIPAAGPSPEELAAQAAAQQLADQQASAAAKASEAPPIPDTTEAEAAIIRIDAELDALIDKYNDGDLTQSELKAQQTALIRQQSQAQVAIERAQVAISESVSQRQAGFFAALDAYKAAGNEFLWDSSTHLQGWDLALRAVTGNVEYASLPFDRQIKLAHDLYASNYEAKTGRAIKRGNPKPADQEQPDNGRQAREGRPEPIQTLSGFNGDTGATLDDGTHASIDRLLGVDPIEAEGMIARMSERQRDNFLRG